MEKNNKYSNAGKGKETALFRLSWEHKRNQINRCLLHDLSNHWGGVLALSELYCQNPKSDSLIEGLTIMKESALKGRDVLSLLSRLNNSAEGQPTYLDLKAILNDLNPIIKAILPKKTIFQVQGLGKLPLIRAIPHQAQQIFLQLLFNAGEALRSQANPEIQLNFKVDNQAIHCTLSDNGVGIPPTIFEHLFEPFCSQFNDPQHVGLGLYTVQAYLTEMGGHIQAESSKVGAKFHFSFPITAKHE